MSADQVDLVVNGVARSARVPALTTLQRLLHDTLGRHEVKLGCGEGVCGACTVVVDGAPVSSCLQLAAQCDGARVITAAGLAEDPAYADAVQRLRAQFVAREAFQCGYCAPGMMASAACHVAAGGSAEAEAVRAALSSNVCRCTGYQQIVESVCAAARGEPAPAAPDPRVDIADKVAGAAEYPTDTHVDDQLVGRVVWSPVASGRLTAIDTRAAAGIAGVVRVLTHRDLPGLNEGGGVLFRRDQPLLAVDEVRSCGDAVALVVATSDAAARRAAEAVQLAIEPRRAVYDVLDALAEGAPAIGPHGNVIAQFTEVRGDVDAAMAGAAVVVSGEYRTGVNDHACMELEGGAGWIEGDTLVVRITSLSPHAARESIARALGWPERRIRVETPRMGGSFGKYLMPGIETQLAVMVHAVGRPVRLVLDRSEILTRRAKRHSFHGRYRLGLAPDGRFLALEADVIADAGPYTSLTPTVVSVFAEEAAGAYEIPDVRVLARGVLTNNLLTAPMRGFGSQQINFGIESLVDKAARAVGLTPIELRRRNFLRTRKRGGGGSEPDPRIALSQCIDKVVELLGDRPAAQPGKLVGRGVAAMRCKYGYPYGMDDRFVVRVAADAAGQFTVETDVADSGTGIVAAAGRMVRSELGLTVQPRVELATRLIDDPSGTLLVRGRVSRFARWAFALIERLQKFQAALAVELTSSLTPPREARLLRLGARPLNFFNGLANWIKRVCFPHSIDSYVPRTSGSRGMLMVGRAAIDAARRLRDAAIATAAARWQVAAARIAATSTGVRELEGTREATWAELAAARGGVLAAVGDATILPGVLLDPATGNQIGPTDHMFAVHGVDLEVDVATGMVSVLRYVGAQDVGHVWNPEIVRGQVIGSIAMGVAQALWERIVVRDGAVENDRLHDYLVPTALDALADPLIVQIESGDGKGPGGAKGCGEVGTVAAPCAIANALYDALGVQLDIPATPDEIAARLGDRTIAERAGADAGQRPAARAV